MQVHVWRPRAVEVGSEVDCSFVMMYILLTSFHSVCTDSHCIERTIMKDNASVDGEVIANDP